MFLFLFCLLLPPAFAPVFAQDYSITLDQDRVRVRFSLNFFQNMSRYQNITRVPIVDRFATAAETENATRVIQVALSKMAPNVRVDGLTIRVNSTGNWINVTSSFQVLGSTQRFGDVLWLNLTWKSFRISEDLRLGNLTYNLVGRRYLRPTIDFFVNATKVGSSQNATIRAVTFFINGTTVPSNVAADRSGNATIFDFSALGSPVSSWKRVYSVTNNTTTWDMGLNPVFNITVRAQELNRTFNVRSLFRYATKITTPGISRGEGDVVKVDVSNGFKESTMAAIIIAGLGALVFAQIRYRRATRAQPFRRRKR